ncbi:Hypothetical protein AT6N2_L1120 [Agrobacterium tumefaciens]|nr:Hypothetical protein AT6N2_L1120 [Agrobacterium tumefaciens]
MNARLLIAFEVARTNRVPRVQFCSRRILYGLDVIHTPTRVITSPLSIINVRGSENSIHAHSIVTGGLR